MAGLGEIASLSSAVSLGNWKRLSNALLEFPELSAVYWRDYIVVINVSKGDCLLYNVKWNMWSRLEPKFPERPAYGSPLVCFNDKLLALGSSGILYEFLPEMSRWEKSEAFDVKLGLGDSTVPATMFHGQQFIETSLLGANFMSSETTLFMVYAVNKHRETRKTQWGVVNAQSTSTQHALMKMYDGLSWSHPSPLNLGQKQVLSVALHSQSQTIYINTNQDMYSIRISSPESVESSQSSESTTTAAASEESITTEAKLEMTMHAAPPHKMSTLSVIDDCLYAFGGKDQDNQPFATVYCYSPESNSWQKAGSMLSSRYGVAVSTVKRDQDGRSDVYVIGGYLGETSQPQSVKIGCRIIEYCSVLVNGGD